MLPVAAVIVAVPLPTAVASPEASIVATEALALDHATETPDSTRPFWSRTSAENRTVSPNAVSSAVAGVTVTVVGRGGSGGGAEGSMAPSPHATAQRMATVAQAVSDLCVAMSTLHDIYVADIEEIRLPFQPKTAHFAIQ